jgi:hypothetical protein
MTGTASRSERRPALTRQPAGASTPAGLQLIAGRLLIASGIVAAVGVAFLVAMFGSFAVGARGSALPFGRINDVLVLIAYALAAPGVLAVHSVLRPETGRWGGLLALIGLAAIAAIVVLQAMLVAETLTFEQQIGPVSLALLVLGGWLVAVSWIGRASGRMPVGVGLGLLAALYVGYPIWAVRLGRHLVTRVNRSGQYRVDAD